MLSRLEGQVNGLEDTSYTDKQLDRLEGLVARLESLKGGSGAPQTAAPAKQEEKKASEQPKAAAASEDLDEAFKKQCLDFTELRAKTKELGNDVMTDAVKIYIEMIYLQLANIEVIMCCKKQNNTEFMMKIAKERKKTIFDMGKKARPFMTHLRVIEDSFSLFNWFLLKDTMDKKDFLAQMVEFAGGLDFQGAKLADMKEIDKLWYRAIRKVHYNFKDFVVANFPTIIKWGSQADNDDALSFYEGSVEGAKALMGDQAVTISAPQPPAPVKKEVPTGGAPAKAAPAVKKKKEPSIVKKPNILEYADYNKETIKIDNPDPKMSYSFFNCERC